MPIQIKKGNVENNWNLNKMSNQKKEKIKIIKEYDKDDTYMLGDDN